MKAFFLSHWDVCLAGALALGILLFLLFRGKKKLVCEILLNLVTEAEKRFGGGTGTLKFSYVLEKLYALLPAFLRLFLPYATLSDWIEDALATAKAHWAVEAGLAAYLDEGEA